MLDEFDDQPIPVSAFTAGPVCALDSTGGRARVARLVCRLYRAATPALRSRLVACLVKPLGTLGTVGIAAGAFGVLLHRGGSDGARAALDEVARFSNEQMIELARFVEQVSPDALQEFARMFTERPMGVAAFSASAALLLMRAMRQRADGHRQELVTK
jgi:hypothetical protein